MQIVKTLPFILVSALAFILSPLLAQERLACPEARDGEIVIEHTGHILSYNPETMLPNWVAYELKVTDLEGYAVRRPAFSPDPDPQLQGLPLTQHWHYTNSGWVRGHMVPAGDLKYSQEAMNDSFYTTNVCPMNKRFNNGIWKRLEEVCRRWSQEYGQIYIVTGPIIGENRNGKVGDSDIVVPDAYFKAVVIPCNNSCFSIGFLMDNAEDTAGKLRDFTCTVSSIEELIDRQLFVQLDGWRMDWIPLKELGLY